MKLDASDDNLNVVAQALGGLLNYLVTEVRREGMLHLEGCLDSNNDQISSLLGCEKINDL